MTLGIVKLYSNNQLVRRLTNHSIQNAAPYLSSGGELISMEEVPDGYESEVSPQLVWEITVPVGRYSVGSEMPADVVTIGYWVGPSISYCLATSVSALSIKSTNIQFV